MKKRVCLFLVLFVSATLCVQGFATEMVKIDHEKEYKISLEQYVNYVHKILPDLAKLPDVCLPVSNLYITQPIEIQNDNDDANYAFFLFDKNSCIGEIVVSYVGNSFCASFLYEDMPAVSAAYTSSTPISLVSMNNSLLMCSEGTSEIIVGGVLWDSQERADITQFQNKSMNMEFGGEELQLVSVAPIEELYSPIAPSSRVLDVPFVKNEMINGEGTCWAAATASIVRYLTGNTVATARSVYNTVSTDIGMTDGYNDAVLYGLAAYGVNYYTGCTSSIPFEKVINQIDADYPVYIAIKGKENGKWRYYHAVVICGYMCETDGTDYIEFVDPNVNTGKVWVTIDRNTNAFTFVSSGYGTYTDWYWTVHSSRA